MKCRLFRPLAAAVCALLCACSTSVTRDNPFDPEGTGPKIPGRISGTIWIQDAVSQNGIPVTITDSAGATTDEPLTDNDAGEFTSAELNPGVYSLSVVVPPTNGPIEVGNIEVLPAQTTEVGRLVSLVAPPSGIIVGTVELQRTAQLPANVRVIANRIASSGDRQGFVQFTDTNGVFRFQNMPAGDYEIFSDLNGFTPAWAEGINVATPGNQLAMVPQPLIMYPASAVFVISVPLPGGGERLAAPYTGTPDIDLVLLPFGGVNEMRFSESAEFLDAMGVEEPWQPHIARVPFTLTGGEGVNTVYAQFRVMQNLMGGGQIERLRTEPYEARTTVDLSPPLATSFEIAPNDSVDYDGIRYLTGVTSAVPIEIDAVDIFSTVAGYKLIVEGNDPGSYDTMMGGPSVSYFPNPAVTPTDGVKTIGLQLIDVAGNESAVINKDIVVDTTAPIATATPGIGISPISGTDITGNAVTLTLFAGEDLMNGIDGPVLMRYAVNQPADNAPLVSFQPVVNINLGLAHGAAVTINAIVYDRAGNPLNLQSDPFTLNLRGAVRGTAYVEGIPEDVTGDHSLTEVCVYAIGADTSMPCMTTGVMIMDNPDSTTLSGAFGIADIPVGTYQIKFTHLSPETIPTIISPVPITAAATTEMGIVRLLLARGNLTGVFRYGDLGASANHGGVTVSAFRGNTLVASATTDETGAYFLTGLPVATDYVIRGSADGYLSRNISPVAVVKDTDSQVLSGAPQDLTKLSGDFKICATGDTPPKDCTSVAYTSASNVLLGFDVDPMTLTHVRYVLDSTGSPGENSFGAAAMTDPPGPMLTDCSGIPEVGCWHVVDSMLLDEHEVDISSVEGPAVIVLQFWNGTARETPGIAQVIRDTIPPLSPSLSVQRGAAALLDGFTNSPTVTLTMSAVRTLGVPDDTAPLDVIQVSRSMTYMMGGPNGDTEYTYGSEPYLFGLDAMNQTTAQNVYAWFCDAAGNCTAAPVTDWIYYDATPPARTQGIDIVPVETAGITPVAGMMRQWWARGTNYTVDISVGDSTYDTPPTMSTYDVPEIASYQLSVNSNTFVGATWTDFDLASVAASDTVTAAGAALLPVDDTYEIYARFKDAAGNVSSAGEITLNLFELVLDTTSPAGSVILDSGAAYTNAGSATPIVATFSTDVSPVTDAAIHYTYAAVLPDPSSMTTPYPALNDLDTFLGMGEADGTKTLLVRVFDPAGNYVERSDSIVLDRTDPEDTLIARCDSCTTDPSGNVYYKNAMGFATFFLFGDDITSGISEVQVDVDAMPAAASPLAYAPFQAFLVSTTEGTRTLDFTFVDGAGNSRALTGVDIIYDVTAPIPTSVSINSNNPVTGSPNVTVTFTGDDGGTESTIAGMFVSNNSGFTGASQQAYSTSFDWTIATSGTNPRTVYVKLVDYAGNVTAAMDVDSDSIDLDLNDPVVNSASLTGPVAQSGTSDSLTGSADVTLAVNATDATAMTMVVANNADLSSPTYSGAYMASMAHNLCTGLSPCNDGNRPVYIELTDAAGNSVRTTATTDLDRTPPDSMTASASCGSCTTDGSTDFYNDAGGAIDLVLFASDDSGIIDHVSIQVDAAPAFLIDYEPLANVTISTVEMAHSITVAFVDPAGNSTTVSGTVDVTYDNTRPQISLVEIEGGANWTTNATVSVAITATDTGGSGVNTMKVSNSASLADAIAQDYVTPIDWTLGSPGTDSGTKTVYVKVTDYAGNQSGPIADNDDIGLDTTAPALAAEIQGTSGPSGSEVTDTSLTKLRDVDVTLTTASDATSGLSNIVISNNSDLSSPIINEAYTVFAARSSPNYDDICGGITPCPGGTGQKTVYIQLSDVAGNSATTSTSIVIDEKSPEAADAYCSSCSLNAGEYYYNASPVTLALFATDNSGSIDHVDVLVGATLYSDVNYAPAISQIVPTTGATRTVTVTYFDAAGNETAAPDFTIAYDGTDPAFSAGDFVINDDDAQTSDSVVTVTLNNLPGSDIEFIYISNDSNFSGAPAIPTPSVPYSEPWVLSSPSASGTKTVYIKAVDFAGNSGTTNDTIVLDLDAPVFDVEVLSSPGGNPDLTSSVDVDVNVSTSDTDISDIVIANTADFASPVISEPWSMFQARMAPNYQGLNNTDGTQRAFVKLIDTAGNESVGDDSIILDTTPPTNESVSINGGAAITGSLTVSLTMSASDATSGVTDMLITDMDEPTSCTQTGGAWQPYEVNPPSYALDVTADAQWKVCVWFRDAAGVESILPIEDTIIVDTDPPATATFNIGTPQYTGACNAGIGTYNWINDTTQDVEISATDLNAIGDFQISEQSDFSDAAWITWPGGTPITTSFTFGSVNAEHELYVRVRDTVGNIANATSGGQASGCVTLDTEPPEFLDVGAASLFSQGSTIIGLTGYDVGVGGTNGVQVRVRGAISDVMDMNVTVMGMPLMPNPIEDQFFAWPDNDVFTANWSAGDGTKLLELEAIDPAGNVSAPFGLTTGVLVDTQDPAPPSISFIKSINHGALMSWTATQEPAGESQIASFRIDFASKQSVDSDGDGIPDGIHSGSHTVTGAFVDSAQVLDETSGGLVNKQEYDFQIVAIDSAGNDSDASASESVAVGWEVRSVVSNPALYLVPQSIEYHDGKIYLLYHEQTVVFQELAPGPPPITQQQLASRAKLIISEDGGDTWRTSVVQDPNSTDDDGPVAGRLSSVLSIGSRGISVITVAPFAGQEQGHDMADLVEYVSEDDGLTWRKATIRLKVASVYQTVVALSVAKTGSSRLLLYNTDDDGDPCNGGMSPCPTNLNVTLNTRRARARDDVRDADSMGNALWWEDLGILHTDPGQRYSLCNANFIDRATWTTRANALGFGYGTFWTTLNGFHGAGQWQTDNGMGNDPGDLNDNTPARFITNTTMACAGLGSVEWFYLFGVSQDNRIYFKARTGENTYSTTEFLAPDLELELTDDAEDSSAVAAWSSGPFIYTAYRRVTDGALVAGLGINLPPTAPPCVPSGKVCFQWYKNVIDDSGDSGYNPVMTGYAEESPVIAYTDIAGTEIKIARAAVMAPQAKPDIRDGLARFAWSDVADASGYLVATQDDCMGAVTNFLTVANQTSWTGGNKCVETVALDDNFLPGDGGQVWQLGDFGDIQLDTDDAQQYKNWSSRQTALVAGRGIVAALSPSPDKLRLVYSSNNGGSFAVQDLTPGIAGANCLTAGGEACFGSRDLAMTYDSSIDRTYVHVFYARPPVGVTAPRLEYVRASYGHGGGGWSFPGAITLQSPAAGSGGGVNAESEGGLVGIAFLENTTVTSRNPGGLVLRGGRSTNHGGAWNYTTLATIGSQRFHSLEIGSIVGGTADIYFLEWDATFSCSHIYNTAYDLNTNTQSIAPYAISGACEGPQMLAGGRNEQFVFLMRTDGTLGPRVRNHVTSKQIQSSANPGLGWIDTNLNTDDAVVLFNSLDAASYRGQSGDTGSAWAAYSTCSDLGLTTLWELKLAYCQVGCHSIENWLVSVIKSEASTQLDCTGEMFGNISIAVDQPAAEIHVSYTTDPFMPSTPDFRMLRAGYIRRVR